MVDGPAAPHDRMELLARLPLFGVLEPAELEQMAGLFVEESYRKGAVICHENEESDRLWVVLDGELEVTRGDEDGPVIQRIGPGELVGEVSLLLRTPRTATVVVRRAARLLALGREPFERAFMHNAQALEYISRILSKRLAVTSRGHVVPRSVTIVAVTGEHGLRGKSLVAATLAQLLHDLTDRPAVLVRIEGPRRSAKLPDALPLGAVGRAAGALRARLEGANDEP